MAGIDRLISSRFSEILKESIDKKKIADFEKDLFLSHGMSIKLGTEHPDELSHVLSRHIGSGAAKLLKKTLEKICTVKKKKQKTYEIAIQDPKLNREIIKILGDDDYLTLIEMSLKEEVPVTQLLKKSKIPKTSAYRKLNELIMLGVLSITQSRESRSKKALNVKCVFEKINVSIDNCIEFQGEFSEEILNNSGIIKMLVSTK